MIFIPSVRCRKKMLRCAQMKRSRFIFYHCPVRYDYSHILCADDRRYETGCALAFPLKYDFPHFVSPFYFARVTCLDPLNCRKMPYSNVTIIIHIDMNCHSSAFRHGFTQAQRLSFTLGFPFMSIWTWLLFVFDRRNQQPFFKARVHLITRTDVSVQMGAKSSKC